MKNWKLNEKSWKTQHLRNQENPKSKHSKQEKHKYNKNKKSMHVDLFLEDTLQQIIKTKKQNVENIDLQASLDNGSD